MYFHLSDQGWVGTESCPPGVAGYDLSSLVSPEHVDPSHCFDFPFNIHSFYRQKAPEVPMKEVAFWFGNTGHLEN